MTTALEMIKAIRAAGGADLLFKGDVPGHEFHGNQFTGGGGGAAATTPTGHLDMPSLKAAFGQADSSMPYAYFTGAPANVSAHYQKVTAALKANGWENSGKVKGYAGERWIRGNEGISIQRSSDTLTVHSPR